MKDVQYFSKLRGFLSGPRRRNTSRAGTRRTSRFRLESLEARVLLSADLGGALSVAEILNSPTIGAQQAVVQNVQPVQVAASTSSVIGTINIARATHENGNAYVVSQDFGTGRDTPSAATVSDLHIFENGRELGPAHSVHADIENLGNGRFKDVSADAGPGINELFSSRGAAFGDYDNDGDIDVVILNMNDLPSLLRNDGGNLQNWIKIKLVGTKCNRTAIGARVRVITGNHIQMDEVHSGASVMSQCDLRLHFGLGKAQTVDVIEVKWPTTQKLERFTQVKANQIITIREGSGIVQPDTTK